MSTRTDPQILADYVEQGSEAAFAELVRRHVDLVYSAALRMTCDPHSAQDVTQLVFVTMAREARKLQKHPVLSAWLHRTARNVAANVVRSDVRRRAREQAAIAMNPPPVIEPDTIWERIAPQLDTAIGELSESDRNALMLRFLEGKSAREIGEILGVNAETAQKRVHRAVERLREFFGKRGITINAGSLGLMIASKGVQSAPTGLAAAISSAVAAAGGAATTATVGIPIAMNWTTAKTAAAIILAGAVTGTGTYLAQRGEISRLRAEVREFASSEARLKAEREADLSSTQAQEAELERFRREQGELIRLRGQVASMRRQLESQGSKPGQAPPEPDQSHHSPGAYIAKDELSYAGYATPEAALETISWAMMNGSYEQANEGLSPDLLAAQMKEPRGPEQFEVQKARIAPLFKGMQVFARKALADDKVELKYKQDWDAAMAQLNPRMPEFFVQPMAKVGGAWRISGSTRGYQPEWDNDARVETFIQDVGAQP